MSCRIKKHVSFKKADQKTSVVVISKLNKQANGGRSRHQRSIRHCELPLREHMQLSQPSSFLQSLINDQCNHPLTSQGPTKSRTFRSMKSLKSPHNMFLLRTARQQPRFVAAATSTRVPAASISRRFASGDYGSGEHNDLKRSKSDHEHPGPPPPSTGDKGSSKGASQQKSNDSGSSQTTSNGAKPKILSASPPKEGEEPPEVAKHNEEIRKRADKPNEGASNADAEKDKVSKSFWKGA